MLDAALTAAKVVKEDLPHDAPAEPRPPAERLVDVGDADDIVGDEGIDFPRQRRLQAIGDMTRDFLAGTDGLLSEPRVEFRRSPNSGRRGFGAANDLYEAH